MRLGGRRTETGFLGDRVVGWLLLVPQSECTGLRVSGSTDTLQCIE